MVMNVGILIGWCTIKIILLQSVFYVCQKRGLIKFPSTKGG